MCEEKHSISDFNCLIAQLIESEEGLDFDDALENKALLNEFLKDNESLGRICDL